MVERPSRRLLRRHVSRSPHHHARLRAVIGCQRRVGGIGRANIFCQPKVEHLDAPFIRDHDIGGLQVAMHDALVMRRRQRVAQRTGNLDDLLEWSPP